MKEVTALASRYLADPVGIAGLNPRQSAKLETALVKAERITGWSRDDTISWIISAAALRLRHGGPTLYINNIGSSGSHWLNAMLRRGIGLLGAGEIYVPARFLKTEVAELPAVHRPLFLQSVYLAHLMTGRKDDISKHVSNTAHLPSIAPYVANDLKSLKILLVRDPLDIVLSRTLRKPEYRSWLGSAGSDDTAYLEDNIRKVDRFFRSALPKDYDMVCRYEDLVANPVPVLDAIGGLLGMDRDPAKLQQIAAETRRETVRGAAGRDPATSELEPAGLRAAAEHALADLRGEMGYL